MSKLSKLVKNPELFMKDFVKNKISTYADFDLKPKTPALPVKTITSKKTVTTPKKASVTSDELKKKPEIIPDPTLIMENISNLDQDLSLIHCGEGLAIGCEHSNEWIKLTNQIKNKIVILVRNLELYKKLSQKFSDRNIVYAKNPIDIEELLKSISVKNICFVSNTANNIHLLRFNNYYHIFIGHFNATRQPEMHKYLRVYDELWLPSEKKHQDFLSKMNPRHLTIKKVENPYNDYIFSDNKVIKNVLYIPSFDLDIKDSFLMGMVDIIEERKHQEFIFNLHLEDGKDEKLFHSSLQSVSDLVNFVDSSPTKNQILCHANVVVCDFQNESVIAKYLSLNIPVLIYVSELTENKDQFILKIKKSKILSNCYVFSNKSDLFNTLNRLKDGFDDLLSQREDFLLNFYGLSKDSKNIFEQNLAFLAN